MDGRRHHSISITLALAVALWPSTMWAGEEHPPPDFYNRQANAVVYTTDDSAVVEAETKGAPASASRTPQGGKRRCHLEAVDTTGDVPGLGEVSLPTPPDERAYWVMCDGENVGMVWRKIRPASSGPSAPSDVADRLRQEIPMPQVSIRINPNTGLSGAESWFWVEGYTGETITNSTDAFGTPVEVEAKPTRYEWSFGDGTSMMSDSLGRAYPERSEIRHVFEKVSPTGYEVTVRFVFQVRYRVAGGQWASLPGITRTASAIYRVRESQAVISR